MLPTTSDETAFRTSTERHDDAPPLRHDKTTNGVPHLDGTARRRTSVASRKHEPLLRRKPQQRNDAPLLRHETEVTIVSNEGKIVTDAPLLRHEPLLRRTPQQRIDAPPLRHDESTHLHCVTTNVQTKRRLHLHCNATNTNTIPRTVTKATNNDDNR